MNYELLRSIHLFSIAPCVPLGFYLIVVSKKGSNSHKLWGKVYALLISVSSLVSLFLGAHVGPTWLDHFGYIHLLSALTIATVPYSLWQLKRGRLISHKRSMQFLYWTGLMIAGAFTLYPGRYLHGLIFE
jgi:uncharacterized membrane protein